MAMPRASQSTVAGGPPKEQAPLLLHFDVNKTVIQSDSIQAKGIEDGIREGIAELFWGHVTQTAHANKEETNLVWEWAKDKPSCYPPVDDTVDTTRTLMNYFEYCRKVVKDKDKRKQVIKTFKMVGEDARAEMHKLLHVTMKKMQLPNEVKYSQAAEEAGLKGFTVGIFPTLFHFVAALQRSKRQFAILFRSFGVDHMKIQKEWNAFCEMRHPVYSKFIEGVGPLDGTVEGVPDRRIHNFHTLYRDSEGPMLILNTFTNGPEKQTWDSWGRQKPKPTVDSRDGRTFVKDDLGADSVDGLHQIQGWMKNHLDRQETAAIKDDWAWWQFHGEQAFAGKLLTLFDDETEQLFFDDNIEISDTRIVDCRDIEGYPVPWERAINKICTKVNPVEALLDDGYFLRKLQLCHGGSCDLGASLIDFQRQLTEVEDQKMSLQKKVKNLTQQLKTLTDENRRMKLLRRMTVRNDGHLKEILAREYELESFGKNGYRSISDLYSELEQGHCWLEQDENGKIIRSFEMVFLKVVFKCSEMNKGSEDLILIESSEQTDKGPQGRNYLPGVRKVLREPSFQSAIELWQKQGLPADISECVAIESPPVYLPEAPSQQTTATQAYPIPCKVQQSEATLVIAGKTVMTHQDLVGKIGLPNGKHFNVQDQDVHGSTITRFFRWDKIQTWEAQALSAETKVHEVDIAKVIEKLFRGHPRKEAYENLLLQMFEVFDAKTLCGGFSGSVVIRVQPFQVDGKLDEPCIVKLDQGDLIRSEFENSVNVFNALPDRAARILGEAVYTTNKAGQEFGAMRLELAGACWNVPELAQGSANLLSTFKDLLIYESQQMTAGTNQVAGDIRPFGNVNSVLAETFGPGGVVGSLRNGGDGLRMKRAPAGKPLLWGWYTLKGKETKFNPITNAAVYPPSQKMHQLYKKYFGVEMPNLKELVVNSIKPKLEDLANRAKASQQEDLFPLIALGHGDLNAANIMIDALDAVWLIDFATSIDLPLFTDMCKFEMACLFEYATIPVTPQLLLEFASSDSKAWSGIGVSDWLRVDGDIADNFMRALVEYGSSNLANISQKALNELIEREVGKSGRQPHKEREIIRSLKARLCTDLSEVDCAFKYCETITNTLLVGDYIFDSLNVKAPPVPSEGQRGAMSLKFFIDIAVSIRRFMTQDLMGCLRAYGREKLQPCDALSLQIWLPILRESYRLCGYRDISPQHKIWVIYHCSVVAKKVNEALDTLVSKFENLHSLPIMDKLESDLANDKVQRTTTKFFTPRVGFSEGDSLWIHKHSDVLPNSDLRSSRIVRKVHAACPMYKQKPGFYAPIFQILRDDGVAVPIVFSDDPTGDCTVQLKDTVGGSVTTEDELSPLFDPLFTFGIGYAVRNASGEIVEIRLKSRLLYVTTTLLKASMDAITNTPPTYIDDQFDPLLWSGGLWGANGIEAMTLKKPASGDHGIPPVQLSSADFQKFLHLDAVLCDRAGNDLEQGVKLVLGTPSLCYPVGSKLCMALPQQRQFSSEVVVIELLDTGFLHVCDAEHESNVEGDFRESLRDFHPICNNHVFVAPCRYEKGKKILVNKDRSSWVDCEVVKEGSAETGFRYRLLSTIPSMSSMMSVDSWHEASGERPKEAAQKEQLLRNLTSMNSGLAMLSAASYEDEVHKMKQWMRARHSFIIDALSGMRLGVKACAVPTLLVVNKGGDTRSSVSGSATPSPRLARKLSIAALSSVDVGGQDPRHGWNSIVSAMSTYEKAEASCSPNAFLILGSPGSGKSCLVCRLVMDCLESHQNLVPILLVVSDLVKRSQHDADACELDAAAISTWFDKYLRLTFGEDSQRYKMVRQAICMHRAVFVFEGLEDASGRVQAIIERFVRDLVLDRHFVVITSRPLLAGTSSSLEGMDAHLTTMELQTLSDEQQRSIAHSRLGLEGLNSFIQFLKQLRQGQTAGADEEGSGQDSVFGNPMMLSMLLCYLQIKQGEKDARAKDGEEDSVTITAVYRVAVDVMLNRVQSKQQADRHNKEQKVKECMRILQKMAMRMQIKQESKIDVCEFEKMAFEKTIGESLGEELRPTWESLKSAVIAGHAVFLRMSSDEDRLEFHFLVKGFQDFFAACEIGAGGGDELPNLDALLTDPWWAQMLEMLAENSALRYVRLVENALENFKPQNGMTFLHRAADVGHQPVFKLLKQFSETQQAALCSVNSEDQVPLHVAARHGHTDICALMIQQKAPVDAEDAAGRLPMHVALQQRHIPTAKFLLDRYMEMKEDSLQDGTGSSQRRSGMKAEHPAERLAARILGHNGAQPFEDDEEFIASADEVFPELRFYSKNEEFVRKGEIGALLSVYWICNGQYEQFIRCQAEKDRLTPSSWEKLQHWTREIVQLTSSPAIVTAMLVFCAIKNLGKIVPLRTAFAPGFTDPSEALKDILEKTPSLIPSVSKLDMPRLDMILSSLKGDFNFGQFLQAENLPASVVIVKEIFGERPGDSSVNILGFFLFKIFAAMCGLFGGKDLKGSLFMNETNYSNYRRGLEVMQFVSQESAAEVYDRFLARRAESLELQFAAQNLESRALVRLACLARVFDAKGGKEVSDAFYAMHPKDRSLLTGFLNADGITTQGFLLYNAPELLFNARQNPHIGLLHAMKILLRIYQYAEEEYRSSEHLVIVIMCSAMAQLAQTCQSSEVFQFTKFEITRTSGPKSDSQGSVKLSPWQKMCNQKELDDLAERGMELVEKTTEQVLREPQFVKQLEDTFPELKFFAHEDSAKVKEAYKQTYAALLVAYWLASDQSEPFTRAQASDKKLSDRSWKTLTGMLDGSRDGRPMVSTTDELLNLVFVCIALNSLGKIPKFKAQLAPHAREPHEVMEYVLDTCPDVLPSYMRLEAEHKKMAKLILTRGFKMIDFIKMEAIPANLTPLSEMLRLARGTEFAEQSLDIFLLVAFAELAGSLGHECLEGSLYMNEDAFSHFWAARTALVEKLETFGERVAYDALLDSHAQEKGLPTEFENLDIRAGVRLACLAQVTDTLLALKIIDLKPYDKEERAAFIAFMNADGITEKPAFILRGTPEFLRSALGNTEVGITPAVRILLKVYAEAAKKFQGSTRTSIIIQLGKLVSSAKTFSGSGAFQDMPFELKLLHDGEGLVIPKRWIPVTNPSVLQAMRTQGKELASDLMAKKISEQNFIELIGRTFPELSYFSSAVEGGRAGIAESQKVETVRHQTMGALLSIFWLLSGQHEAFIRCQPNDDQLTLKSWAWIQEWIVQSKLVATNEAVDAAFVFMAIHALGKIPEFRKELASGTAAHMHDVALAHILEDQPEVVPSFSGLSEKYRRLIIDSLGVDFQFKQFLQAENTPANLVVVKERLAPHGDDGFAFFCFRVFTQMCGRSGEKSLKGSLFMTESMFQRFRPGLEVLQQLHALGASATYQAFLLLRSSQAMPRFASPEHQALARLLCLGSAFDTEGGRIVCEAFDELHPEERAMLTNWLNSDGIEQHPDYLLCSASQLLTNAMNNSAIGLASGLRMLLKVQDSVSKHVSEHGASKVILHLSDLANSAKTSQSIETFFNARLAVDSKIHSDTAVFYIKAHQEDFPPSPSENGGRQTVGEAATAQSAKAFQSPAPIGYPLTSMPLAEVAPAPPAQPTTTAAKIVPPGALPSAARQDNPRQLSPTARRAAAGSSILSRSATDGQLPQPVTSPIHAPILVPPPFNPSPRTSNGSALSGQMSQSAVVLPASSASVTSSAAMSATPPGPPKIASAMSRLISNPSIPQPFRMASGSRSTGATPPPPTNGVVAAQLSRPISPPRAPQLSGLTRSNNGSVSLLLGDTIVEDVSMRSIPTVAAAFLWTPSGSQGSASSSSRIPAAKTLPTSTSASSSSRRPAHMASPTMFRSVVPPDSPGSMSSRSTATMYPMPVPSSARNGIMASAASSLSASDRHIARPPTSCRPFWQGFTTAQASPYASPLEPQGVMRPKVVGGSVGQSRKSNAQRQTSPVPDHHVLGPPPTLSRLFRETSPSMTPGVPQQETEVVIAPPFWSSTTAPAPHVSPRATVNNGQPTLSQSRSSRDI